MRYLRYRYNYILWALYSLAICIYFTMQISLICSMVGLGPLFYFFGTAGCAFLLILAVYMPFHMLSEKKYKEKKEFKHAQLWECLFLIFVVAAALLLRLWMASSGGAELYGDRSLYESAAAAAAQPLRLEGLHFDEIFLCLLTFLFSVIGVWENHCILLQLALQIAAIILLYPAIRLIAGKTAAVTAVTAAALIPVYVEFCLSATSDSLQLLCFSFLLLLLGVMLQKLKRGGKKSAAAGLVLFLTGFTVGFFAFVDYFFLSVLLLVLSAILHLERRGVRMDVRMKETAAFFIAGICGFAGALCLQIFLFGGHFPQELYSWFSANVMSGGDGLGSFAGRDELFYFLPLLFPAFFYVFGYFEQKDNLGIIWILPFVFLLVSNQITGTALENQTITLLFWAIFAGMGIHGMCCFEKDKKRRKREGHFREKEADSRLRAASLITKRRRISGEAEKEESDHTHYKAVGIEARLGTQPDTLQPGEPIPNPLPVPRKHVPREMNFAYEPRENEMCFDIDIFEEGDDYDLL